MALEDELKAQIKSLSARRSDAEAKISASSARLEAAGVGLHGSLVDAEGFPRADVDIPAIRADRHAVISLSNDCKELTSQLEVLLHRLHALSRQPHALAAAAPAADGAEVDAARPSMRVAAPLAVPAASTRPFAVIDELTADSPASVAGLCMGDELIQFGHVTGQTPNPLQAIARLLQESEGRRTETAWLRGGQRVAISLVPQRWAGRGLLGCHLQPLR